MDCVEAKQWWGQVGKDLELGTWNKSKEKDWLSGHFSKLLVTLFTFQPDPGSQGLAEKAGRKYLLLPRTPHGHSDLGWNWLGD